MWYHYNPKIVPLSLARCYQNMKPTVNKFHRKWLQDAQKNRGNKASWYQGIMRGWKTYVFLCAFFGYFAFYFWDHGERAISLSLIGFLTGSIWRDIIWLRTYSRFWPISDYVTDWLKVEELLSGSDKNST